MTCAGAGAGAGAGGGGVLLSVKQMFLISRPDTRKERTHSSHKSHQTGIIINFLKSKYDKFSKYHDIMYVVITALPMSSLNNSHVTH